MQSESKGSFAVIRYNLRTYESGGVMAVIKGKESAEAVLKQFEQSQTSEDRHIGWRYFLEKTDLKAGNGSGRSDGPAPVATRNSRSRSLRVLFLAPVSFIPAHRKSMSSRAKRGICILACTRRNLDSSLRSE